MLNIILIPEDTIPSLGCVMCPRMVICSIFWRIVNRLTRFAVSLPDVAIYRIFICPVNFPLPVGIVYLPLGFLDTGSPCIRPPGDAIDIC